jgi:hypothetical protein
MANLGFFISQMKKLNSGEGFNEILTLTVGNDVKNLVTCLLIQICLMIQLKICILF